MGQMKNAFKMFVHSRLDDNIKMGLRKMEWKF
jgi:hypothetical protein